MKRNEFEKIVEDFYDEEKRWKSLKKGDVIYDEQARSFEFDYHKMIIKELNVEERYLITYDVSNPNYVAKLSFFLTEDEFNKKIK